MKEAAALVIAYFLGSIPTAYIVTRLKTGKDIRKLGGGNVGGLNTFREVGVGLGAFVILFDIAKGALAVAVAYWLVVPQPYVLLAGLVAVIGHLWMVWLKFTGGKGVGATIGALAAIFIAYGYWPLFLIFAGILLVPLIITRNIALASGLALVALPFIVWFGTHSGYATILTVILAVLMGLKFLPTALAAMRKPDGAKDLVFDRWQRPKKEE